MAEYWDLYDRDRRPTGERCLRGDEIPDGRYHVSVHVWIRRDDGMFLIAQRHPDKKFGLKWETTGGAVTAGEDSLTGALRELEEELGIRAKEADMTLLEVLRRDDKHDFSEHWLLRWNGGLDELTLQPEEVVDARWASYEEVGSMIENGELIVIPNNFRRLFAEE